MSHFNSNESSEKASLLVMNQLQNNIQQQINATQNQLSPLEKELMVKKTFDTYLHQHRREIQNGILKVTRELIAQDQSTQHFPYLLESDSFYYYDLTKNIIKTGNMGQKKGSKYFNPKTNAPMGQWEPYNIHPYIGAIIFRTIKLLNPQVSLMEAVSYTPLFITAIILIVFLLSNHFILKLNAVVSFVSSVLLVLVPIFVKRSALGWYDNDVYNIFFPLLIFSTLLYAIKNIKNLPKILLAGLCLSILFPIYTLFWQGWPFLFVVMFLSLFAITIIYLLILKEKTCALNSGILIAMFIAGTISGISVIFGIKEFFSLIQEAWGEIGKFSSSQINIWPNIFITVGELNKTNIFFVISETIGWLGCLIASGYVISSLIKNFTLLKNKKELDQQELCNITVLSIFATCGIYLALGAQRFTFLCVTPLILLFALGLQELWDILSKRFSVKWITIILLLTTIIPFIKLQIAIPGLLDPIYNDTWDQAFKEIREKTPPDSIINTWWPPGHFIKAMAERRVSFDGADIGSTQSYWLASFFLSKNEREAAGILRMINNSGNQTVEFLNKFKVETSTAIKIAKEITALSKTEAKTLLSQVIKDPLVVEAILQFTHNRPAPTYCLLYKEFVDNNIQLSLFGKWDFKKMEIINQDPNLLAKIPSRNSDDYIKFLWELVGGPYKYSGTLSPLAQKDNIILFQDNVEIDVKNLDASISSPKYGIGKPFSIFYINDKGILSEKIQPQSNLKYSVALFKDNEVWQCILMDRPLAQSILMRLYYFKDKGLKIFEPFCEKSDLTGRNHIIVYKVNWDKLEQVEK
ncbi:MAG: hypothetical protein HQL25_06945 [Candidatus Omnitrophica bacterium]|nr:hypothetical protein [Candidatus Omnitrophota bacterium]